MIDFSDFLPTICEAASIKVPDNLDIDGHSFFPQLIGKKGDARKWIYCWYSRTGKEGTEKVFARNHHYKLYESGEFYEIPNDYKEKNTIAFDELDADAKDTYKMLKEVLDNYKNTRFNKIPASKSGGK